MQIVIKVLINVHLLVNELCEFRNARCNDKKKMTESCSPFMIASNRAAIFAHSADIMKPMLPHLLYKVHASNPY